MNSTTRVQAARKPIQRQAELLTAAKGHLVALRALDFGTRIFHRSDSEDETAQLVRMVAVDLEGDDAQVLAVLEVSWRRIYTLLATSPLGTWQVGRLIVNDEASGAVELEPPPEDLNLDAIAARINALELIAATGRSEQLLLPVGSVEVVEEDGDDANPLFS